MEMTESDLTGLARIRNAALAGFAREGVGSTSLRDVAKAADVSPGLVQHHFPTKTALVSAVNDYVVRIATDAFREVPWGESPLDVQKELGDRVTAFVLAQPTALSYVARSVADGDETALQIFDAFVALAGDLWRSLAEHGLLREDTDATWTALHPVVFVLGTVLFKEAIERHLPDSFFAPEQLERWNIASNALFRQGLYKPQQACRAAE
jgi:AcrR family transcriptional regulator